MHKEQIKYCERIRNKMPQYFSNVNVLDVGSLDVNGNNKHLFDMCAYIGIDIIKGKNVDMIKPIHECNGKDIFNTIICTEMLEHDRHFYKSLKKMIELLHPGGLLLITAATVGRQEHGTYKNKPEDSPATNDYYNNVTLQMLSKGLMLDKQIFNEYEISVKNTDIRFYGIKSLQP